MNIYTLLYISFLVKCEAVYRTVYDLEWYNWESKQARNLILLMIRVQQPFRITAGKIVPLTMATFCSVRLLIFFSLSIFYLTLSPFSASI